MWLYIVLVGLVLFGGAYWLFLSPPPHAVVVIRIRQGTVRVTRGQLPPRTRRDLALLLGDQDIKGAYIAVTPSNRVMFSRGIPSNLHQRLRNVLLNSDQV